jgi:hypothetical protein
MDGAAISGIPCALRDSRENPETPGAIHVNAETRTERDEMKMKQILKISAAPAGVFCALIFFSAATPAAAAPVDYCRTDTSGMRGCGYSSLEQCQAMASGRGSNCYENPFPAGGKASSSASGNASSSGKASSSAYAYQPKHHASKGARKPVAHQKPVEHQ